MNDGPAILVTGGAGYIGSHCCRALVAGGLELKLKSSDDLTYISAGQEHSLSTALLEAEPLGRTNPTMRSHQKIDRR